MCKRDEILKRTAELERRMRGLTHICYLLADHYVEAGEYNDEMYAVGKLAETVHMDLDSLFDAMEGGDR